MEQQRLRGVEYRPLQADERISPVQVVDYATGLQTNTEQELRDRQTYLSQVQQSDQTRINNAAQPSDDLIQLSNFSKTLTDRLVEDQKKRNEEEEALGVAEAFLSPPDLTSFNEQEEDLRQADIVTSQIADDAENQGADLITTDRLRDMSGWRRYGYARGLVLRAASDYPMFVSDARETTVVTVTGPDGEPKQVTHATARTREEREAINAQIRSNFLTPFAGTNPELLAKYLFPQMQRFEQQDAVLWSNQRQQEIRGERQTVAESNLLATMAVNPEQAINEFMSPSSISSYGGTANARNRLFEVLKQYAGNNTIPLSERLATLEELGNSIYRNHPALAPGPIKELFPQWAGVDDAMESAKNEESKRANNDRVRRGEQFRDEIRAHIVQNGPLTDEEFRSISQRASDLNNGRTPEWVQNLETFESVDRQQSMEDLEDLRRVKGYLTEDDIKNHPIEVQNHFRNSGYVIKPTDQLQESDLTPIKNNVRGILQNQYQYQEGAVPPDGMANSIYFANKAIEDEYYRALREGRTKQEALEYARQAVIGNIERDKDYYENVTPNTGDEAVLESIQDARTFIRSNNNDTSIVIPNTNAELHAAAGFINTGKGQIPQFYVGLARSLGVDPWVLAYNQLKAAGFELTGDVPAAVQNLQGVDPALRQILNRYPIPSSVMRVALAQGTDTDPDFQFFANTIAAVESEAHGGYDAMNTGGSGIGPSNTAYGSANSSDVFGRGLSTMTLGEVMELQRSGQVFAAGRYQFIPDTLIETVNQLGISEDELFSPEVQDRLLIGRLRWRLSVDNSLNGIRTEWQGLWHIPEAEVMEVLDIGREIVDSVYNRPENLIPELVQRRSLE